jgi:hypothetical protein
MMTDWLLRNKIETLLLSKTALPCGYKIIFKKICITKLLVIILTNNLVRMKKLTEAEEQIMQVLWSLKEGGHMKGKNPSLSICLK